MPQRQSDRKLRRRAKTVPPANKTETSKMSRKEKTTARTVDAKAMPQRSSGPKLRQRATTALPANKMEVTDLSRKEKTTARIIEAAVSVIRRWGVGRMSMRDVGNAAQVSRANLYRHFPSKEDLLAAIAQRRLKDFTAQLASTVPQTGSPSQVVDALISFLDSYYTLEKPVKFLEHEPEFSIAAFRANFPHHLHTFLTVAGGRQISGHQEFIPLPIMAELLIRLLLSDVLVPSAPQPLFLTRFRPYLKRILEAGIPPAEIQGESTYTPQVVPFAKAQKPRTRSRQDLRGD